MSKALGTIGKIAGVVAFAASVALTAGGTAVLGASLTTISVAASAAATAASIGAQALAKKPPARGSVNQITIGTDQPTPYLIGRTYYGGARQQQVGYGPTVKDVPNPYLLLVDIYSGAGPIAGFESLMFDFAPVAAGSGAIGGYSNGFAWADVQLGAVPEARALQPHWGGAPSWGADYGLSGKAAIAWSLLFDKKGKVFASGAPQTGVIARGQLCYDPRKDSTYPGGSGPHRWADPRDTAAHDAARATWEYSEDPGLHALRYALGVYHRDPRVAGSTYTKVFGCGIPIDGLIVDDFVHLANTCLANQWTCGGVIFEPGNRWSNLKDILAAGGAEPAWRGGRLGLKISAPRIALDTISADDLADDDITIAAMQGWEDRLNTLIPKVRSEGHKWEYVQAANPVRIAAQVAEDGEEKKAERQFNLVQDFDQGAQLCAYELLDSRELGDIVLTVKPRLRRYGAGDLLIVDLPEAGLAAQPCVVLKRTLDPATMTVQFVLRGETAGKHDFALGRTGVAPATPALRTTAEQDGVATAVADQTDAQLTIRNSFIVEVTAGIGIVAAAADGTVTIANHTRRYTDRDVAVTGGTIATGLAPGGSVSIAYDDAAREGGAVAYIAVEDDAEAFASAAHPARHYVGYVDIPETGTSTGGGGGAPGGRGGACVADDVPWLMANDSHDGPGLTKPGREVAEGDWVWTQHEVTRAWGAYLVVEISFHEADVFAADDLPLATGEHQFDRSGWWKKAKGLGVPAGRARVVKATIEDARTYVTVQPDGSRVLNHNIKQTDQ